MLFVPMRILVLHWLPISFIPSAFKVRHSRVLLRLIGFDLVAQLLFPSRVSGDDLWSV